MKPEQMESFLDTVILTLYGDVFSPREEYLILKLFQVSDERQTILIIVLFKLPNYSAA